MINCKHLLQLKLLKAGQMKVGQMSPITSSFMCKTFLVARIDKAKLLFCRNRIKKVPTSQLIRRPSAKTRSTS